jgi:hypothetical protein
MERNQSPFGIERRLTPELFDHYVAKARAERAKAIAAFFGRIAMWLSSLRAHSDAPARTSIPVGRKLTG